MVEMLRTLARRHTCRGGHPLVTRPSDLLQDEAGAATPPGELGEAWHARLRAVTQGLQGLAASHLAEHAYSAAITEQLEHRMQVWL